MKYLIFLALVALALAAPATKPEELPGGPKPSDPPSIGTIQTFDHLNEKGGPPHLNSSSPPHSEELEDSDEHKFDDHNVSGFGNSSKPPHSEDLDDNDHPSHPSHPEPAEGPAPTGKPPAKPDSQAKPGQGPKPRPKQDVEDAENHPDITQVKVLQAEQRTQLNMVEANLEDPKAKVDEKNNFSISDALKWLLQFIN